MFFLFLRFCIFNKWPIMTLHHFLSLCHLTVFLSLQSRPPVIHSHKFTRSCVKTIALSRFFWQLLLLVFFSLLFALYYFKYSFFSSYFKELLTYFFFKQWISCFVLLYNLLSDPLFFNVYNSLRKYEEKRSEELSFFFSFFPFSSYLIDYAPGDIWKKWIKRNAELAISITREFK